MFIFVRLLAPLDCRSWIFSPLAWMYLSAHHERNEGRGCKNTSCIPDDDADNTPIKDSKRRVPLANTPSGREAWGEILSVPIC